MRVVRHRRRRRLQLDAEEATYITLLGVIIALIVVARLFGLI